MSSLKSYASLLRMIGLIITVLMLGVPVALVFTHGAILIPLVIVMVLAPFVIINYLLWGWWLSPRRESEDERIKLNSDRIDNPLISNSERIVNKEQKHRYFRQEKSDS